MNREQESQNKATNTGSTTNLDWGSPDKSKISPAKHLSKASKK